METKQVGKEYRPIPFWSWNEKLETEETKRQIREMNQAGMGGFFMHARGGLQTPYMGEEWFAQVTASVEEADICGMDAWAYDENGWPSGFGGGMVNGLGIEYQQKYLRMESEFCHEETAICKTGDHYFYYDVNPFYVDTLDEKVIARFIACTYQPYYERYGIKIKGFFTDEPQISRDGIPWSFVFEEEYQKRYQENIFDILEQLFLPVGDYKAARVKFWKMVTDLFSSAYMKQIHDWCSAHQVKLTGHLVLEETLLSQLTSNGACMPHYEYFDIPGVDWLGRPIFTCLTSIQAASVAEQMGKEAVLTESFALCGHNVSFAELKGIYEWQMVQGINLLCQHLEGYSLRGIRKRDYPPAMYLQQPWWGEYSRFNEAMSREGMILRNGIHAVDVLVLHPQTTAWTLFDNDTNEGMDELNDRLLHVIRTLEQKHVEYHLGDETMMERHGAVEEGKLVIGVQRYSCVIDPGCEVLLDSTKALLDEYVRAGGTILTADQLEQIPANGKICNEELLYTKRICDGQTVHFLVNPTPSAQDCEIQIAGKQIDLYSGELLAFAGSHRFEPWGSLMIVEEVCGTENSGIDAVSVEGVSADETRIFPTGKWKVVGDVVNSLLLDTCDYYFDGELQERSGYVLNICERANRLQKPVVIHQDYFVEIHAVPQSIHLVCETPEKFRISVNGKEIGQKVDGHFRDQSFQTIEIADYLKCGTNTIPFDCQFCQSEVFYENLEKASRFESERNKLAYDMEIEAVYLIGNFSVKTDGEWYSEERDASRYQGRFVIDEPVHEIRLQQIERQGYPFFCGSLTVEGELAITGENPVLACRRKGVNALKVEINGIEQVMLTDEKLPLKQFGTNGKTKVRLTLINNLRNLLGPHHLPEGESHVVSPRAFYREACVWNWYQEAPWNEGYCLVETGIYKE
ncbi:MAG: hypothetical protein IJ468_13715 [Lachnospiraceae bacterium]|nr:hypothetical protein [Lachnospiraceae bacterium]